MMATTKLENSVFVCLYVWLGVRNMINVFFPKVKRLAYDLNFTHILSYSNGSECSLGEILSIRCGNAWEH